MELYTTVYLYNIVLLNTKKTACSLARTSLNIYLFEEIWTYILYKD